MANEKAYFCDTGREPLLSVPMTPGREIKLKLISNLSDDYEVTCEGGGASPLHPTLVKAGAGLWLCSVTPEQTSTSCTLVATRKAAPYEVDASVWLDGPPPTPYDVPAIRKSIVTLARSFVQDSHYLWGTAGNTPGRNDGNNAGGKLYAASMRPNVFDDLAPTDPARSVGVFMAQNQLEGIPLNTCAGRSSKWPGAYMANKAEVDAYLARCKADPKEADLGIWLTHRGPQLFPRRYKFTQTRRDTMAQIVLGESCAGRRHFDCVGLVNYCYAHHVSDRAWGQEIAGYAAAFRQMGETDDMMDADVVIPAEVPGRHGPNSHIAMIYDTGKFRDGKPIFNLVQAADTDIGLNDHQEFDPRPTKVGEFTAGWLRYRFAETRRFRPMHGQFG